MRTIYARNVNEAWQHAIETIDQVGVVESSRNGPVRVAPYPVVTIYANPMERVLFDPVRDANPIFHLHEALWMLAGRQDARWLDQFVSDFSKRYSEDDGRLHGAYGYRWRNHFGADQLKEVVEILGEDPTSRQAVIQMWDSDSDLGVPGLLDRPCNTQIYLRIREDVLDLCVMCRSNDIVWGAYGANAVHFTLLQEYLAGQIGVGVGRFTQFSWNWHMYDNTKHLADHAAANGWQSYPGFQSLMTYPKTFDREVQAYISDPDSAVDAKNQFLAVTALSMWKANQARKQKDMTEALNWAGLISAPDWRQATLAWLKRRNK